MKALLSFAVITVSVAIVGTGCSSPNEAAPELYAVDAPPETVFGQVVEILSEWNMPISFSDEETGVITTDQFVLGTGDRFLGEGAGPWPHCGSGSFRTVGRVARLGAARFRQDRFDAQPGDPAEVAEVAGDQVEIVVQRSRGNLQIGVGQDVAAYLQPRS